MMLRYGLAVIAATVSLSAAAQEDPFAFRDPEPVVEAPVVKVPVQSNTLSNGQLGQVKNMVKDALRAVEIKLSSTKDTVSIDGEKFVLLDEGQRYVGVTSGMFVIYSESDLDFAYYDTQKYKDVMLRTRYESLVGDAKSRAEGVLNAVSSMQQALSVDETVALPSEPVPPKPTKIN